MSYIIAEFECVDCGRFELMVERPVPDIADCPLCGCDSPWVISAPAGRVKAGEVIRGKSDPHPPDKYVMDTRPLAEGMPLHEFKAKRAALHREISLKRARKAVS